MKSINILIVIIAASLSCSNYSEEKAEKENNTKKEKRDIFIERFVFERMHEPNEKAFSILVPKGWIIEGGIYRVDPSSQGGAAQSIAAKLDFTIKKDNEGSVLIRWLPDILYFDARNTPAGQMGLFPEGSNYQGMQVLNIMSAETFLRRIVFPFAHPNATNIEFLEIKNLEKVAAKYGERVKQAIPYSTMSYDASLIKVKYEEYVNVYEEWLVTIIENWGQLGNGMWGNKETFLVRTKIGELGDWEKVFSVIQNSVKINQQWLIGEIRGQAARGEIAANTQKEIERIGREINSHRTKTNSEIQNDMYLTLTEQEEYINPYTNEVEIGTDQWRHRWVNESGDVIYTDSEDYDPNIDVHLNRSDYKKSTVRKRFPN